MHKACARGTAASSPSYPVLKPKLNLLQRQKHEKTGKGTPGRDKATSCAYQYQALAKTPWSPLPPRFSKLATANMVDARLRLSSCPPLDCGERRPIVSPKLGDSTRGPGHREKKKKGHVGGPNSDFESPLFGSGSNRYGN